MKWVPHLHGGKSVYHLTSSYRLRPERPEMRSRLCGVDKPLSVTRPDGLDYCRHCISREGLAWGLKEDV